MNRTVLIASYTIISVLAVLVVGMIIWWLIPEDEIVTETADPIDNRIISEEYIPQYTLDVLTNGEFVDTEEERQEVFSALDALDTGSDTDGAITENEQKGTPQLPPDSSLEPTPAQQNQLDLLEALSVQ